MGLSDWTNLIMFVPANGGDTFDVDTGANGSTERIGLLGIWTNDCTGIMILGRVPFISLHSDPKNKATLAFKRPQKLLQSAFNASYFFPKKHSEESKEIKDLIKQRMKLASLTSASTNITFYRSSNPLSHCPPPLKIIKFQNFFWKERLGNRLAEK